MSRINDHKIIICYEINCIYEKSLTKNKYMKKKRNLEKIIKS